MMMMRTFSSKVVGGTTIGGRSMLDAFIFRRNVNEKGISV
jgi:hypothetical protein